MLGEIYCWIRNCKHYSGIRRLDEDKEKTEVHFCPAYSEGIPKDIADGRVLHKTIRDNQSGSVVYEEDTED